MPRRPLVRTLMMCVSPGQNLFDRQPRFAGDVADLTVAGQPLGQRQTAGKLAAPVPESGVNCLPAFIRCFAHGSGALHRPAARAFVVGVGPGEDLLDCQWRSLSGHDSYMFSPGHVARSTKSARQSSVAVSREHRLYVVCRLRYRRPQPCSAPGLPSRRVSPSMGSNGIDKVPGVAAQP